MTFADFFLSTAFYGNLNRWFRFRNSFCTTKTWNEVMEPPGHQGSVTSYMTQNHFSNFWPLKIIHGHSKTTVSCSTRRKEHAGRWNFALAPSEAKLSAITGFRHFSALDLTSEVTGWPRTLSLYINLFVSRRATCSFFSAMLQLNQGRNGKGGRTPLVPWKDAKWPVPARVNPPPPGLFLYPPQPGGGGVGSDPRAISITDGTDERRRETDEAAFERSRRDETQVGESGVKRTTGAKQTTHLSVHMRSADNFSK